MPCCPGSRLPFRLKNATAAGDGWWCFESCWEEGRFTRGWFWLVNHQQRLILVNQHWHQAGGPPLGMDSLSHAAAVRRPNLDANPCVWGNELFDLAGISCVQSGAQHLEMHIPWRRSVAGPKMGGWTSTGFLILFMSHYQIEDSVLIPGDVRITFPRARAKQNRNIENMEESASGACIIYPLWM